MSYAPPEPAVQKILEESAAIMASPVPTDVVTMRRLLGELEVALPSAPAHMRADILSHIGAFRYHVGDFRGALAAHREAERLEPNRADHKNNIAVALLGLREPKEALEISRRARAIPIVRQRTEVTLWVNEIFALLMLGDPQGAHKAFETAVRRVDRADVKNLVNLSQAAADLGRENDCTELVARFLSEYHGVPRDEEQPAPEFIRENFLDQLRRFEPRVQEAVARVLDRWEAPTPEEHEVQTSFKLDADGWASFCRLARIGPAVPE